MTQRSVPIPADRSSFVIRRGFRVFALVLALVGCQVHAGPAQEASGIPRNPRAPVPLVPHQTPMPRRVDTGTRYFVSPRGDDGNPGTDTRPFRTIQRAADLVNPGDTVIVEDGTYSLPLTPTACGADARAVVCLTRGGTDAGWVSFRSRNKWGAKISGEANRAAAGFRFGPSASHIQIDGFDVFGIGNSSEGSSGFELFAGGHDVVISQNRIHDIGRLCSDTTNGQVGIFVEQPRVTITRNVLYGIGRFAPGEQGCTPATDYYRNHDHGIYLNGRAVPGASGSVVSNNVFYGHARGWAIQLYPGTLSDVEIVNNTFSSANPYNPGQIIIAASTRDLTIANNLFADPQTAAVYFYDGRHTGLIVRNNLSSRALALRMPADALANQNMEFMDPQIEDTDLRLKNTSPAIDRATQLTDVALDIDGIARPQGAAPDIGAREAAPGAMKREGR